MIYYIICSFAIATFFFFLFRQLSIELKKVDGPFMRILFCLILTVLFKYDFGTHFCGLEYEDSYAFSFLAREFANGIYTNSFLSEGIGIGSIDSPVLMQTYGGHFITYSVLLSLPVRLFGFSFTVISITTSLLQFLSLLILSVFPCSEGQYKWMVAPIIYCISPIINVFGNSFLCEPFSGLLVLSFVFVFFKQIDSKKVSFAAIIAFFVAILTKRENLVLIVLPIIFYVYHIIKEETFFHKKDYISLVAYCLVIISYLVLVQNVLIIEETEAQDIATSTFSFLYFIKLAPAFIKSLLNPLYFGITTIILLLLIARSIYIKVVNINVFAIICIWLLYFILYTSHYRSYFFVQGESVSSFGTFRYLNNFYCLTPVLISMLLNHVRLSIYSSFLFWILLLGSVFQTILLRENFSVDEWDSRFDAPQKTLDIIKNEQKNLKPVVISLDVLLLQNIGDNSLFVCDAFQYDMLDFKKNGCQYYLLCRDGDIEYLNGRYNINIDMSKWFQYRNLGNSFKLYKYSFE